MRTFAIFGPKVDRDAYTRVDIQTAEIDDVPVHCGIVETEAPVFDLADAANLHKVLIRVLAFSLNYRDKNIIFKMSRKGPGDRVYVIGSEFVAQVLEVGTAVTELAPGDLVIGNNAYPLSGWDGLQPGIPSNHSSREFQILHKAKLIKVPETMPKDVAAAFSIGGQTTYSMLRRLQLFEGANVLVTSGKSNTSLFVINALRRHKVNTYVTSTSRAFESELKAMGVKELCVIPSTMAFDKDSTIANVKKKNGFHFVIDPYWDLHLSRSIDVMAIGGKYITCGLYDQYLSLIGKPAPASQHTGHELGCVMMKNLSIIGNCIGTTEDLLNALGDYSAGVLDVVIDSTFTDGNAAGFLHRCYSAKSRFGKVVYQYT